MQWLEAAQKIRDVMDMAGAMLTDAQAATLPTLYPPWRSGTVITQEMIDAGKNRFNDGGVVYKTETPHTTQDNWRPSLGLATASLWTRLDVSHAGTIDDPIPAAAGMEVVEGLYYTENGTLYKCTRSGTVYYLPSALIGHYFELA